MAKHGKAAGKKPDNLGKGTVTPVQVAYIVDRYLASNNYTATLSAFREEASDHFSKIKDKVVPSGMMGLGEILNEYVSLKEQRMTADKEKKRVEMALGGMQELVRSYYASAGGGNAGTPSTLPSSPPFLPPQFVDGGFCQGAHPNNVSPPGQAMQATPVTNIKHVPMLLPQPGEVNTSSTPVPTASSSYRKRKPAKNASRATSGKKLSRELYTAEGTSLATQTTTSNGENLECFSSGPSISVDDYQTPGSSISNVSFTQPQEPRTNSTSPKTPPLALPSTINKSIISACDSSLYIDNANTFKDVGMSNCSIVSSEKIIVSPLKQAGYYAVQRSYHVTSSPMKSNTKRTSTRDHVKGRLNFDKPDVQSCAENAATVEELLGHGDADERFNIDFPDIDFFCGETSFSQLLLELDLTCSEVASQPIDYRPENILLGGEGSDLIQTSGGSCLPSVSELLNDEDMDVHGDMQ